MLKKIFSYLSVLLLGLSGASAKSELSSAEFEAMQQAELNARLQAEQEGESVFCGQCDDVLSMSEPPTLSDQQQAESDSE